MNRLSVLTNDASNLHHLFTASPTLLPANRIIESLRLNPNQTIQIKTTLKKTEKKPNYIRKIKKSKNKTILILDCKITDSTIIVKWNRNPESCCKMELTDDTDTKGFCEIYEAYNTTWKPIISPIDSSIHHFDEKTEEISITAINEKNDRKIIELKNKTIKFNERTHTIDRWELITFTDAAKPQSTKRFHFTPRAKPVITPKIYGITVKPIWALMFLYGKTIENRSYFPKLEPGSLVAISCSTVHYESKVNRRLYLSSRILYLLYYNNVITDEELMNPNRNRQSIITKCNKIIDKFKGKIVLIGYIDAIVNMKQDLEHAFRLDQLFSGFPIVDICGWHFSDIFWLDEGIKCGGYQNLRIISEFEVIESIRDKIKQNNYKKIQKNGNVIERTMKFVIFNMIKTSFDEISTCNEMESFDFKEMMEIMRIMRKMKIMRTCNEMESSDNRIMKNDASAADIKHKKEMSLDLYEWNRTNLKSALIDNESDEGMSLSKKQRIVHREQTEDDIKNDKSDEQNLKHNAVKHERVVSNMSIESNENTKKCIVCNTMIPEDRDVCEIFPQCNLNT